MQIVITVFCVITFLQSFMKISAQECRADRQKEWSYQPNFPNGPPRWGDSYPDCTGSEQSPINIVTNKVSKAKGRQFLNLNGYDTPISEVSIENDGHTIVVTPQDNVRRSVKLESVIYNLESFHFHWSNNTSNKGSEHEINGQKYAMEAHFVHRNSNGQIVVVGVLFQENYKLNAALDNILSVMSSYEYEDESYRGTIRQYSWNSHRRGKIYLGDLVDDGCHYYRYDGSLTTPPCSENVNWLLCKNTKSLKSSQLNQLYSLYSVRRDARNKDNCHLINNYRPTQSLNGRKVYA